MRCAAQRGLQVIKNVGSSFTSSPLADCSAERSLFLKPRGFRALRVESAANDTSRVVQRRQPHRSVGAFFCRARRLYVIIMIAQIERH